MRYINLHFTYLITYRHTPRTIFDRSDETPPRPHGRPVRSVMCGVSSDPMRQITELSINQPINHTI